MRTRLSVSARITRAAARPSMFGIRMSIRTTVGASWRVRLDGLPPVAGFTYNLEVRFGAQDDPEPRSQQALVVDDEDRNLALGVGQRSCPPGADRGPRGAGAGWPPGLGWTTRQVDVHPPAFARRRTGTECPATASSPLPHARHPVPAPGSRQDRGGKPGRSIDNVNRDRPNISLDGDVDGCPGGMLHGIGNRFLDQPVGGVRTPLGQVLALADEIAAHGDAGGTRPADEPFYDAQPGPGAGWLRRAKEMDQTVDLHFGFAGRVGDRGKRFGGFARVQLHQPLAGPGLYHHEADAVGDDVVQLAGDPGPLIAHRGNREYLLFFFQLARTGLELGGQAAPGLTTRPTSQGPTVTISKRGLKPLLLVVLTPAVRLASPISDGPIGSRRRDCRR